MIQINRQTNNFDLVRLVLATIVVIAHTAALSRNQLLLGVEEILNPKVAVDSFFIISGFLIFMSYENSSSLKSYISKRAKRILPGYVAVIVICAFALFFVSTATFRQYFNLEWIKYIFFNLITLNFLQSTLPGVFTNHTTSAVNNPLWTIKVEMMFYVAVPFVAYVLGKTNKILAIAAIYLLSILYSTGVMQLAERLDPNFLIQLEQQLPGQMAFFVSGALLYYYYDKFHRHAFWLLAIAAAILIVHNLAVEIYFLYPLALAIAVIYFCLIFKYLGNFGKYGDFSYGMYIWHFPIMQVFVSNGWFDRPWVGIPSVFISVSLVAYLSWHLIEKPFLNKRSHYVAAQATAQSSQQDYVTK